MFHKGVTKTEKEILYTAAQLCDTGSEPVSRRNKEAFRMMTMAGKLSALGDEENAAIIRRRLFSMGYFL